MSTNDSTTPKTNDTTTPKINDSTTTPRTNNSNTPKTVYLATSTPPTQDLDKEHLIPTANAEIEETDMFGAGDADCSDQERYDRGEIE
ncbi:hypothetical protein F8M41_005535 [Gigaspora margarita]|uniref:Uncharacterized protein n=1 Tax=Gigaspora margarita TaxID=4874 RepID=A0A8H3X802_GIGMA|nr:hypothetical protein F8M41_005535 [Gigaspora margarita]